jgi:hypothetical protein
MLVERWADLAVEIARWAFREGRRYESVEAKVLTMRIWAAAKKFAGTRFREIATRSGRPRKIVKNALRVASENKAGGLRDAVRTRVKIAPSADVAGLAKVNASVLMVCSPAKGRDVSARPFVQGPEEISRPLQWSRWPLHAGRRDDRLNHPPLHFGGGLDLDSQRDHDVRGLEAPPLEGQRLARGSSLLP